MPRQLDLEIELKSLIAEICDIDDEEMSLLKNDEPLVGADTRLQLDSLDSLEITVAIQKKYMVRIDDKNTALQVLKSINALSEFIRRSHAANDN